MISIRDELLAFDTNVYVFAVREAALSPTSAVLLLERTPNCRLFLPLQVFLELQRILHGEELHYLFTVLDRARELQRDFAPAPPERLRHWQQQGAKKGDAVIAAQLENAGVRYLVSENRHFLAEIAGLPFEVLTSAEALRRLGLLIG